MKNVQLYTDVQLYTNMYNYNSLLLYNNLLYKSLLNIIGKNGHIDHPRSFLRDHASPAAKDHPKLTSFFASFSS